MILEFGITAIAAATAIALKRDMLAMTMGVSWLMSLSAAMMLSFRMLDMSLLPGAASMVDLAIAGSAFYLWSEHASQRARLVGFLSLAKLFIHFGLSANMGNGNWFAYALSINALFVLQCIIASGAYYGMVAFFDNISPRYRTDHHTNNRKET